jgi:methylenetetrahydrofolate dehydrogenase (NADP+)/methenyltetrahydrofolate cyclohydrolase
MSAVIIDGRAVAERVRAGVEGRVRHIAAGDGAPTLAVVLVGDDPASAMYVRNKERAAARLGIRVVHHTPPASVGTGELVYLVRSLGDDDGVDAILVQLPLPRHVETDAVIDAVDPRKDADGFHPLNLGQLAAGRSVTAVPCTPAGCMELLRAYDVPIAGSRAVVIGRSTIVGRPLAIMLTNADATVTVCHSKTRDLAAVAAEADILVAALGRPAAVDASYVKPGACVIDVGTTPVEGGVVGDVDRARVEPVAGWLTPVPGGVGPMTIAMLMRNTVELAAARRRPAAARPA